MFYTMYTILSISDLNRSVLYSRLHVLNFVIHFEPINIILKITALNFKQTYIIVKI